MGYVSLYITIIRSSYQVAFVGGVVFIWSRRTHTTLMHWCSRRGRMHRIVGKSPSRSANRRSCCCCWSPSDHCPAAYFPRSDAVAVAHVLVVVVELRPDLLRHQQQPPLWLLWLSQWNCFQSPWELLLLQPLPCPTCCYYCFRQCRWCWRLYYII